MQSRKRLKVPDVLTPRQTIEELLVLFTWAPKCAGSPSFFPVLDLLVYVLPFFSSPWLSPLLYFISSSLPLLLPFYL